MSFTLHCLAACFALCAITGKESTCRNTEAQPAWLFSWGTLFFFSFQIIIYNPLKKKEECDFICHFYLHYNHMGAAARTMIPKLALAESPCQREWHEEGHRDDTESLWHCAGGTERDIHGSGLFLVAVAVAVLTVLGAEWKQGRWK